jgi:predicted lipid-binding transport protein (Tim44 family)
MNDTFDLTTILFLVVAVVIFLRLRSVLGRRTGNERPRMDPYAAKDAAATSRERDNVVTLPRTENRAAGMDRESARNVDDRVGTVAVDPAARDGLRDVASADPTFDTAGFIMGGKAAYEMIVTAFAQGDRETLAMLLSREVFESFDEVMTERENQGETTEFSFVGITSADIVEARMAGNMAHVGVKFVSELISSVRDKAGELIEGDPKKVREVTDIWTFARDVTSANPNWRLVATETQ